MNEYLKANLTASLKGKKILLGITGSIAAFKAVDLVRFLKDCEAEVQVVLSENAKHFVTETTLGTLSGRPALSKMWGEDLNGNHHIDLARWADLVVIAPATANSIAKLAGGFSDDLLSTEVLAFQGKVMVAPAMNPAMFENPVVQENLKKLEKRGMEILGPDEGVTSCGEEGKGRLLEPIHLLEAIAKGFYLPSKGKSVLISLGPTRSYLDPVRYLTNRSSGQMGAAFAWSAVEKGYDVTVVQGPSTVLLPKAAHIVPVETAEQMKEAVLSRWSESDLYVGTAAILDWDFAKTQKEKIKKNQKAPDIALSQNVDVLKEVGRNKKKNQFVLGFAAETENFVENAETKLKSKNCDAVFVNDVSKTHLGFESFENGGFWVTDEKKQEILPQPKPALARKLLKFIEAHWNLNKAQGKTNQTQTKSAQKGKRKLNGEDPVPLSYID